MNEDTRRFLEQCKDAGYELVAIGVKDKRVPASLSIEWYGEHKFGNFPSRGLYTGAIPRLDLEGKQNGWQEEPHVVCCHPKRRESGRPAIWEICEKSNLTSGMDFRGFGCGESHSIRNGHGLDLGLYEVKEKIRKLN